ncbi:hypothetical protein [Ralstonia pickettii]|uniref:hypothetical protein n=1 Tax=Ralstonia pickettii TaxID=329 RepID=UPI002D790065|nr:hypothetical protein [Ralstonia pickettii]
MTVHDVLWLFAGVLLGLIGREFLPGYLRRKGENLATKEDIGRITSLQEEVKHGFNLLLEESKQRHGMRMIVAAERMAAHQQAFVNLKRLLSAREDTSVIEDCRQWADNHCLYLSTEARKEFWRAIGLAEQRAHYLKEAKAGVEPAERWMMHDKAVSLWSEIESAFQAVVSGVELPALGVEEVASIVGQEREEG